MRFDIVTIFPKFFTGPLDYGIVRRAREAGLIEVRVQDLRAFAHDRHRTVDDRPFGGGEGMVLKPEPLFEAVESLLDCAVPVVALNELRNDGLNEARKEVSVRTATDTVAGWPPSGTAVVLLSASGKSFCQADARRLASLQRVVLLCGRYEGVDERVAAHLASEEISIGDFVLSGGELAAALVVDAVTRLLPGALGNEESALHESFSPVQAESFSNATPGSSERREAEVPSSGKSGSSGDGSASKAEDAASLLLDYPHYTRPAEFRGWGVPNVLLGGNHEEIRRWRQRMAVEKTRRNRPDLLRRLAGGS